MNLRARQHRSSRSRSWARRPLAAALVALALVAAACGDDDDADDAATATTAADGGATTAPEDPGTTVPPATEPGEPATTEADAPVEGGEMTVLTLNEVRTLDPVGATGSAGADGMPMFSLYGALITYDPVAHETVPLLAESFEPGADFTTWTLVLRDGLVFSDGAAFDAAAVQANWERAQDPANRSQAIALASSISEMTAVEARTLEITLAAPNAHFDNSIARQALNYVASPDAFGGDLANEPVGAGPFLLEERLVDDHTTLVANPDWQGSDGPYLERLVLRPLLDEGQRVDTYVTGDADLFYTSVPSSVERATDERGGDYAHVAVSGGGTIAFNTTAPPLDDPRVRRAIALAVDNEVAVDVVRPGAIVATNPVLPDTPWYTADADYPSADADAAQALFDEYAAEVGPVEFTIGSFQNPENVTLAEFVQTTLNQFDGVTVEVDVADAATATTRVLQGDFQAHTWGFPVVDADPGLYNALHSGNPVNVSRYANPDVDALLDQARSEPDPEAVAALYQEALVLYAQDLPFLHTLHPTFGWVHAEEVGGAEVYEDGILRTDLLHRTG